MRYAIFSFLTLLPLYTMAQDYTDCNLALDICSKGSLHFGLPSGQGQLHEIVDVSCYPTATMEFAPTWVAWEIAESGTIEFILTPDGPQVDLDFYVFRLPSSGQCESKEEVRCMASGENVGEPFSSWAPCIGPTGLLPGNTDTSESPGCQAGDNNFLAPLQAQAGEAYVLLVENFTGLSGFTLDICGTAKLPCDSSSCTTLVGISEPVSTPARVFPNPSKSGIFNLQMPAPATEGAIVEIFNPAGQLLYRKTIQSGQQEIPIGLSGLADGWYILRWQSNGQNFVERLFKNSR